jgi:hypothetical protein
MMNYLKILSENNLAFFPPLHPCLVRQARQPAPIHHIGGRGQDLVKLCYVTVPLFEGLPPVGRGSLPDGSQGGGLTERISVADFSSRIHQSNLQFFLLRD